MSVGRITRFAQHEVGNEVSCVSYGLNCFTTYFVLGVLRKAAAAHSLISTVFALFNKIFNLLLRIGYTG